MNKRTHQGFTLIEVMIALSVVAIGLMATLKAINEEINGAIIIRNKMIALWVLENKIAEIRLNANFITTGTNEGQQNLYNQTWIWKTNTTNTANTKIRKVEIAIFTPAHQQQNDAVLTESIYLADLK